MQAGAWGIQGPSAPKAKQAHARPNKCSRRPVRPDRGHSLPATATTKAELEDKLLIRGSKPSTHMPSRHQTWRATEQVLQDVVGMFKTQPLEFDYHVEAGWVEGHIPKELQGTYYRNGPGLQVACGKHQRHFMDGDGCVLSLAFPGQGALPHFISKFVRTEGFVAEQAAGKPIFRNAFTRGAVGDSVLWNPLDLNFKNVANTACLAWAGRLWALWEVGRPYELCPHTLDTIGESDIDGQVGQRVAGHYRVMTQPDGSQRLVLFGAHVSLQGISLEFYELDEAGRCVARTLHSLLDVVGLDITFVHDMLVTEHWYIVHLPPVEFDSKGFFTDYLASKRSLAELLVYNGSRPSKVLLFPRPGKLCPAAAGPSPASGVRVIETPPTFSFHHLNAYETQGGAQIVMDTIGWQGVAFDVTQYTVTPAHYTGTCCRSELHRLVLDLPTSSLVSADQVMRRTVEFPTFNPTATGRPYQYAWLAGDAVDEEVAWGPPQALLKLTLPTPPAPAPSQPVNNGPTVLPPAAPGSATCARVGLQTGPLTSQVPLQQGAAGAGELQQQQSQQLLSLKLSSQHQSLQQSQQQSSQVYSQHQLSQQSFKQLLSQLPSQPFSQQQSSQEPSRQSAQQSLQQSFWQQQSPQEAAGVASHTAAQHSIAAVPASAAATEAPHAQPEEEHVAPLMLEWRPGPRAFLQEPLFVGRPGATREDDGWIIVGVHNADTQHGSIVILDATTLEPLATLHLPHALPPSMHGTWSPGPLATDGLGTAGAARSTGRVPHRIREYS